jgi:formate--tetrahydrofolate ligase
MEAVATKLYGAKEIVASAKVKKDIEQLQANYGHLPICMAKTQMSFSTDPALKGAPTGHVVEISDVKLQNGAGFIVAIAGNMMTMPGLPTRPTAEIIDIDDEGVITGLF